MLAKDPRVFLLGQGLWSPWYAGTTLKDLEKEFGRERVIDSPVCENATTAMAIGSAMTGMRPIVFHPRMDFMVLASDPIINQAANWAYLFAGQVSVPVVIRATINRGGQQGAQHSQALQAMYAHVPGLKVVMPASPADAKGLLIAAVQDPNPVLYVDDRWLYEIEGPVPEAAEAVAIGKARIVRTGNHLTVVASSYAVTVAEQAADSLERHGISVELIDLRSVKPIDESTVLDSVRKTGHCVVVDGAWRTCGISAEVAAFVSEQAFDALRAPVQRVTLPDLPAPVSRVLEEAYYLSPEQIVHAAENILLTREKV